VNSSVREALARAVAQLQAAGIESARLDARLLLSQALDIPNDGLFSVAADADQIRIFESLVARRAAREPLAYITGSKEFWSLDFEVGPGVLVPRPETETLIEEALRQFPGAKAPLRVLDIGTGSGCLLVAYLSERPNATGLGIDSSGAALAYARRNAARHGLEGRCSFELAEAPDGLDVPARQFDVILANPPYLTNEEFTTSAPEITNFEPQLAFTAGDDGLNAFRAFLPVIAKCLAPSGMAFLEIGAAQAGKVTRIAGEAGLEVRFAVTDLSGIPRCLAVVGTGEGSPLAPLKNSVGKEPATR
jgi:release factor glutamine methyltransferase